MSHIAKSCSGGIQVDGKVVSYGWNSVQDWLQSVISSFPAPWIVGDLDGKYYGTEIFDATGSCIMDVWLTEGQEPSTRQRGEMSDEEWSEYCCDSHWESASALGIATAIVGLRNSSSWSGSGPSDENLALLVTLVTNFARWNTSVYESIKSGGAERRLTPIEADALYGKSHGI